MNVFTIHNIPIQQVGLIDPLDALINGGGGSSGTGSTGPTGSTGTGPTGPTGTGCTGATGPGLTFPLLAPTGSTGTPMYSFESATGSGMYMEANGSLGFSVNHEAKMTVAPTGIGFGTTTPNLVGGLPTPPGFPLYQFTSPVGDIVASVGPVGAFVPWTTAGPVDQKGVQIIMDGTSPGVFAIQPINDDFTPGAAATDSFGIDVVTGNTLMGGSPFPFDPFAKLSLRGGKARLSLAGVSGTGPLNSATGSGLLYKKFGLNGLYWNSTGANPTGALGEILIGEYDLMHGPTRAVADIVVGKTDSAFTGIQSAISFAALTATSASPKCVWVRGGVYSENLVGAPYVSLQGQEQSCTIIQGITGSGPTLFIPSSATGFQAHDLTVTIADGIAVDDGGAAPVFSNCTLLAQATGSIQAHAYKTSGLPTGGSTIMRDCTFGASVIPGSATGAAINIADGAVLFLFDPLINGGGGLTGPAIKGADSGSGGVILISGGTIGNGDIICSGSCNYQFLSPKIIGFGGPAPVTYNTVEPGGFFVFDGGVLGNYVNNTTVGGPSLILDTVMGGATDITAGHLIEIGSAHVGGSATERILIESNGPSPVQFDMISGFSSQTITLNGTGTVNLYGTAQGNTVTFNSGPGLTSVINASTISASTSAPTGAFNLEGSGNASILNSLVLNRGTGPAFYITGTGSSDINFTRGFSSLTPYVLNKTNPATVTHFIANSVLSGRTTISATGVGSTLFSITNNTFIGQGPPNLDAYNTFGGSTVPIAFSNNSLVYGAGSILGPSGLPAEAISYQSTGTPSLFSNNLIQSAGPAINATGPTSPIDIFFTNNSISIGAGSSALTGPIAATFHTVNNSLNSGSAPLATVVPVVTF